MNLQKSGFTFSIDVFSLEEIEWVAELKSAIDEWHADELKKKMRK